MKGGTFNGYTIHPIGRIATCPNCKGPTVELIFESPADDTVYYKSQVFPRGGRFPPSPPEVPATISQDYAEANEVLAISPKASAALSRRCLQSILSAHGYNNNNLVKQVESAIGETDAAKSLPSSLRDNIDAIRNFGNFSAHPITDQTTLQIVDVEEGEAEWCLQILLDMFDHYYVAPAKAAARRASLSAKLAAAGKPPMKS
ncbi:hypothetical protein GCM10008023_15140 [Sphingomonas glacialis]|uniref:DUF4145 domain-containing protein n=2 Tax=Sphingomonas glacialis TaxID=658225 RepID=A0ABQ3LF80_9SPHN|nr:hypothetical protein GCM10008023_15140 [Sphingomonas glacialis]